MKLEKEFQEAKAAVESLETRPSNDELLSLYGLYKQAMFGDNHEEEPEGFDFKAIAKHRAWMDQHGKTPIDSMLEYIELSRSLLEKYGG